MVRERREQFRSVFHRQLTLGILICVLAAVPLGFSLVIAGDDEFLHVPALALMLALIGVGAMLIVRASFSLIMYLPSFIRSRLIS